MSKYMKWALVPTLLVLFLAAWPLCSQARQLGDPSYQGPAYSYYCPMPIGLAPTGTMGANGALSTSSLGRTYSEGIWLYFPSNAVASGSAAGFYYTVMSSSTAGTVYADTYTPGTSPCNRPSSPTAVVDAGPGAFTGVTGSAITVFQTVIPGGSMGPYGKTAIAWIADFTNSASAKNFLTIFGGTTVHNAGHTSALSNRAEIWVQNKGVTDKQYAGGASAGGFGATGSVNTHPAIDTDADVTVAVEINRASATDFAIFGGGYVESFFIGTERR